MLQLLFIHNFYDENTVYRCYSRRTCRTTDSAHPELESSVGLCIKTRTSSRWIYQVRFALRLLDEYIVR